MVKRLRFSGRLMWVVMALAALVVCVLPASAAKPSVTGEAAILIDASTGQVLFEKDADKKMYPAAATGILTALLAAESSDGTETLSVTATALAPLSGGGYKSINLKAGELITMSDCIKAMLLVSANDAANVIAEAVGGSIAGFSVLMNQRAAELGATGSNFTNPSGGLTDENHYTTARDLALITMAAMKNETFKAYFGLQTHTISPTNLHAEDRTLKTNYLMHRNSDYTYAGSLGGKLGRTSAAGYVVVSTAERDGRRLIAVVLKNETEAAAYKDAAALLNYGFTDFALHTITPEAFGSLSVTVASNGVQTGTAIFYIAEPITVLLETGIDPANIVKQAQAGMPSVIDENSQETYTAEVYYVDANGNKVVLRSGIVLSKTISPVESSGPSTTETSPSDTSSSSPGETTSGTTGQKVAKFFKLFLVVLLIVVGSALALILLFILTLYIIRAVKRSRRRKARRDRYRNINR